MNTYETNKRKINKLNYDFQSDNLIALAKMILIGHKILRDNKCEDLITSLMHPKMPPKR